ncbi:MAG: cytochrome c oxidase subunit [Rhodospirillales bacterium]|nr:cytochrome c oxidase subunit [Rhodospirillales bacterium]
MNERIVLDVSHLTLHGKSSASVTWWGTFAFMLLEGTGFALLIAVYLYLESLASEWPLGAPPPDLGPGSVLTAVLIASLVPNYLIARWAEQENLHKVRIGIVIMTVLGIVPVVLRFYEFPALHISWDSNAYGSILWALLGLHLTHLVTDLGDTVVLAILMFTRHGANKRRLGDIQDNALYWNFVVATWLPIYVCIYWVPRL